MKRWPVVLLISIASLVFFGLLAAYGWRTRYGPRERRPVEAPKELAVPYADREVELRPEDLRGGVWDDKPSVALSLVQQATDLPWAKEHTPEARVQAFHNGSDIFVRVEWESEEPNREHEPGRFADACALGVAIADDAPPETMLMGFGGMMNYWHWKADLDAEFWEDREPGRKAYADRYYPFDDEEVLSISRPEVVSAAADLIATRPGSLTRKERQLVQARGAWEDGVWSVVFKRALRTDDPELDAQFGGDTKTVSVAVWEGERGDRGGRKSISDWLVLRLGAPGGAQPEGADPQAADEQGGHSRLVPAVEAAPSPLFRLSGLGGGANGEERVIEIRGRRFEYEPNRITVQRGDVITFRFDAMDVPHGLFLDGYGVDVRAKPGRPARATFVADKTGRFSFRCSVTCGEFHPYMIGFLTVEPNNRFRTFLAVSAAAFVLLAAAVFVAQARKKEETGSHAE